jgi:pimeloyl-ACP methyl ester carboxylesterase
MPAVSNIYYFVHEAEDLPPKRPPVILIHGAGGNHLTWPPQIRRLPGLRLFAVDLPGHGKSEGMGRQSIEEYADDIFAFMKSLRLRSAVLAGISMGGAISLTLAVKYPTMVSGLVLLGSGAKLRVAPRILESLGSPNMFESAVEMINENCFCEKAPQRLKELSRQIMMEMRPPVLLGDFLACDQFDITDRLHKILVPTLIVCGAEDKMTPLKYSESLKGSITGAQLKVVDGAGHMVMVEQPAVVAEMLLQFINAHSARTQSFGPRRAKRQAR